MTASGEGKSTEASFVPERHWGLARLNAVEVMALVVGIALCSIGRIGVIVGVPIALGALYSGFFVKPRFVRGILFRPLPALRGDDVGDALSGEGRLPELRRVRFGQGQPFHGGPGGARKGSLGDPLGF